MWRGSSSGVRRGFGSPAPTTTHGPGPRNRSRGIAANASSRAGVVALAVATICCAYVRRTDAISDITSHSDLYPFPVPLPRTYSFSLTFALCRLTFDLVLTYE